MMKLLSKLLYLSAILWVPTSQAANEMPFPLAGSWTLVAADLLHPDGTRTHDYGEAPKGLLLIDNRGHYSAQIYKSERPLFASGDKKAGTAAEFEAAVMGTSAHFGTLMIDKMTHTLIYNIESSAYKNWEGTQQKRVYELHGDELSYQVPARPDGLIPISIWRRIK
jgi:Lipocalin-like domain